MSKISLSVQKISFNFVHLLKTKRNNENKNELT